MGEILKMDSGNTLYEMNKQIVAQEKPLTPMESVRKQELLKEYFESNFNMYDYYMLLCHEKRDYTVFRVIKSAENAARECIGCIFDRGELVSCEYADTHESAIEIWLKSNDEAFCYYLFPYDMAVIEV